MTGIEKNDDILFGEHCQIDEKGNVNWELRSPEWLNKAMWDLVESFSLNEAAKPEEVDEVMPLIPDWRKPMTSMDPEEIKKALGRKYRHCLSLLRPLVDTFKYISSESNSNECIMIPTSAPHWMNHVYKDQRQVAFVVKCALKIHLIYDTRILPDYKSHVCRRFLWNKKVEKTLLEMFKDLGIKPKKKRNHEHFIKISKRQIPEENKNLVISSRINGRNTANLSDFQVRMQLLKNEPLVRDTLLLVDQINENLHDNLKIIANVSISRGQKNTVSKLGFRPTTSYCSLKDHDISDSDLGKTRSEFLSEHFGGLYNSFDVKSSIYKITRFINSAGTESWLPNTHDLYADIYNDGKPFESFEQRDSVKLLTMSFYFDGTPNNICHHFKRNGALDHFLQKGYTQTDALGVCHFIKDRMRKALHGNELGAKVFVYESFMYLKVYEELLQESVKWNLRIPLIIYDCFYVDPKSRMNIQALLKKVSKELLEHLGVSYTGLNRNTNGTLEDILSDVDIDFDSQNQGSKEDRKIVSESDRYISFINIFPKNLLHFIENKQFYNKNKFSRSNYVGKYRISYLSRAGPSLKKWIDTG